MNQKTSTRKKNHGSKNLKLEKNQNIKQNIGKTLGKTKKKGEEKRKTKS